MISLKTRGSSGWKRSIAPLTMKIFSTKSKIDTIQFSPHLFQRGISKELGETKGLGMFPRMSTRRRFTLSWGLTCTPMGRCRNQQTIGNGNYQKKLGGIEMDWPYEWMQISSQTHVPTS